MRVFLIALFLLLPVTVHAATTYYVRPATDSTGAALTYGAGDGTSSADAFVGFADIAGLAAGDTVCLPGSDEPFSNGDRLNTTTAGTAGLPITWSGCGDTPFLIWNAQSLSGNRSFDNARAVISTSTYAWATVATDIYRKRIDIRPQMLWEDDTWLQPVNIDAASEATILTTLTAGQWGVKNNGDSTYRIYYKSSTSAKSPTTTVIRCDDITTSGDAVASGDTRVDVNYQTFSNGELRGYTGRAMGIIDASHITLTNMSVTRSRLSIWVSGDATASSNILFTDTSATYMDCTGAYLQGGAQGVSRLTINGGTWGYALGTYYNGTSFTSCDGDGIGIGQAGGNMRDVIVRNVDANYNANAGVFLGTSEAMTVTNFSLLGSRLIGNGGNGYAEGNTTSRTAGHVVIAGNLFQDNGALVATSTVRLAVPEAARTVIVANNTFKGNANTARLFFMPDALNTFLFYNLVFEDNPGAVSGNYGDITTVDRALTGSFTIRNIYFYSAPNLHKFFATLGVASTRYYYDVGGDLAAFNTATGATGTVINTDPLLNDDGSPATTSPLRRAGLPIGACRDVRDRVCPSDAPHIGAYQATSGDPAATRAAVQ